MTFTSMPMHIITYAYALQFGFDSLMEWVRRNLNCINKYIFHINFGNVLGTRNTRNAYIWLLFNISSSTVVVAVTAFNSLSLNDVEAHDVLVIVANLHFASMYTTHTNEQNAILFIYLWNYHFFWQRIYVTVKYNLFVALTLSIYTVPTPIYGLIKRYGSCLESECHRFCVVCVRMFTMLLMQHFIYKYTNWREH